MAQVDAAEQCRTQCAPAKLAGHASCCGEVRVSTSDDAAVAGHHDGRLPAGKTDPAAKYCPGCGARPLAVDTPRLTLTLDLTPVFVAAPAASTSASFDVPFAIFHPPRV